MSVKLPWNYLLLLPLLPAMTGCAGYMRAPGAMGRVVDAESGTPIHHAKVTRAAITPKEEPDQGLPEMSVTTGRYGRFRFPEARYRWQLINLFGPQPNFTSTFSVAAAGYENTNITATASSNTET